MWTCRSDQRADIFSYGVVVWELITQEHPQRGMLRPLQVITIPSWQDWYLLTFFIYLFVYLFICLFIVEMHARQDKDVWIQHTKARSYALVQHHLWLADKLMCRSHNIGRFLTYVFMHTSTDAGRHTAFAKAHAGCNCARLAKTRSIQVHELLDRRQ